MLMDVQMPVMDGMAATRLIRALEAASGGRRVPILALTANAMTGMREEYLAAGMDDFVLKPIRIESLLAKIMQWTRDARGSEAYSRRPIDTAAARRDFPKVTQFPDLKGLLETARPQAHPGSGRPRTSGDW